MKLCLSYLLPHVACEVMVFSARVCRRGSPEFRRVGGGVEHNLHAVQLLSWGFVTLLNRSQDVSHKPFTLKRHLMCLGSISL